MKQAEKHVFDVFFAFLVDDHLAVTQCLLTIEHGSL